MPKSVWSEEGISIIDYGCGQGIAEMGLSDYIASKWIDNDFAKDFTLMETYEDAIKFPEIFELKSFF